MKSRLGEKRADSYPWAEPNDPVHSKDLEFPSLIRFLGGARFCYTFLFGFRRENAHHRLTIRLDEIVFLPVTTILLLKLIGQADWTLPENPFRVWMQEVPFYGMWSISFFVSTSGWVRISCWKGRITAPEDIFKNILFVFLHFNQQGKKGRPVSVLSW